MQRLIPSILNSNRINLQCFTSTVKSANCIYHPKNSHKIATSNFQAFFGIQYSQKRFITDNIKMSTQKSVIKNGISYLCQEDARNIDEDLFNEYSFSVDQLMELAGLSCAHAIHKYYPPSSNKTVLVCCGPGNNGGDGLVCARHLKLFGYDPTIFYPKRTQKDLYRNLTVQNEKYGVKFMTEWPSSLEEINCYGIVVDALFGFSFKPPVRKEFVDIIEDIKKTKSPVISIDVPSGWSVENETADGIKPDCLISLTAPKMCAQYFSGRYHILGGRFVPDGITEKYQLKIPPFNGMESIVELPLN